jgi:uncharacterized membrane protein HdeD (DUF308 family)
MPCNPDSSGGIKVDVNIAHRDINELHKNLGWYIALAIAMMILGVFAIFAPYAATFAVERLAGIAFAVGGIILVIHAFRWRIPERFFFSFFLGLIYFAFGIFLLAYPLTGILSITMALALLYLAVGVVKIINAFRIRPSSKWGWVFISGLVSVLLSVIIWGGMPLTALWAVGLIVGIDLVFSGMALLMLMLAVRSAFDRRQTFCIGGECYSS